MILCAAATPVLQCVAVCCRVLQCVAECCSVLQCVAACCSAYKGALGVISCEGVTPVLSREGERVVASLKVEAAHWTKKSMWGSGGLNGVHQQHQKTNAKVTASQDIQWEKLKQRHTENMSGSVAPKQMCRTAQDVKWCAAATQKKNTKVRATPNIQWKELKQRHTEDISGGVVQTKNA